ncbi:MAG: MFS transporter, partial [Gemmatimonadota bacterium]
AYLALERNVALASLGVLLLGFGEELWKKFLPKYLQALGAGALAVGAFGAAQDLLDALYQYPGGWLADRVGRRRAFLSFLALASVGYLIYLLAPSWPWVFVGLVCTMAWQSMASPAIFAVVGDTLPREMRAMGFTVQSILKRVPIVISPLIGGALIAALGIIAGLRAGFAATLVLAGLTALLIHRIRLPISAADTVTMRGVWGSFHGALKRLLVSDIVIRTCEGLAGVFVILYVTDVTGLDVSRFGILVAVQMATSIAVYVPAARIADRVGRKPFVVATFVFFALFPVAVVLAHSFLALIGAFVLGGLREIGEPARKAMIIDLAETHVRARTVGLYYLVRSLTITPAAIIGGLLWQVSPELPFWTAGMVGLAGTILFIATVEERYAA